MRSLYFLAFALVLLLALTAQNSRSQPMKDGKPVTGPNIGSAQAFTAQLWITEHEEFFHEFAQGGNVKFDGTTQFVATSRYSSRFLLRVRASMLPKRPRSRLTSSFANQMARSTSRGRTRRAGLANILIAPTAPKSETQR